MNAVTAVCLLVAAALVAFAAWQVYTTLHSGRCCEGGCQNCDCCCQHRQSNVVFTE